MAIRYKTPTVNSSFAYAIPETRRKNIVEVLRTIPIPVVSARAFQRLVAERKLKKQVHYKTWQRDIRYLAKHHALDILVYRGGKGGCRTIIEGVR